MASVSRGYISRLEAGDFARPSAALLLRIAHALEIDVEHLWEDISSATAPRAEQPRLSDLADQLMRLSQTIGHMRGIPLRGVGSNGTGERSEEKRKKDDEPRLTLEDDHFPPRRWAMKVDGTSLQDAGIHDGDFVVVDPDAAPREGQFVVANVDDAIVIKQYKPRQNTVALEPANPDYPSLETPDTEILGTVCAVVRVLEPQRVPSHA
jgi:phage repressor protein C with HTH and peptisase S24 domain